MKIGNAVAANMPPMTAPPITCRDRGAGAAGHGQRYAAEDEGERGHQDRPQAQLRALQVASTSDSSPFSYSIFGEF